MKKIVILSLVTLSLLMLTGCDLFKKKEENDPNKPSNPVNTDNEVVPKGLTKEDNSNFTNGFDVYYNKAEDEFCIYDDLTKCGKNKVFIKTESDDIKKYNEYEDKYVFYRDNGKVKVYNNKTKNTYVVNIPSTYFGYNFGVDDITKEFVGVMYFETVDSNASFYSVEQDQTIYNKEYGEIYILSNDYLMGNEYECNGNNCKQVAVHLLSTRENKKLLSHKLEKKPSGYYEENMSYVLVRNEKETYISLATFIDAYIYEEIYNSEFKSLAKDVGEYSVSVGKDGSLYIEKNGIVTKYNSKGEVLKSSEKYDVLQLLGDYIVTIKDNKLVLVTMDGDVKEVTSWNKNENGYSLYKSKVVLGTDKIVLGVKDKNVKLDDVWNYCEESKKCDVTKEDLKEYYSYGYEYYFDTKTNEVSKVYTYMQ